ncbi:MAG: hypothetical protein COA84_13705 [Robiginitomaculum sp.]|nr:MAG: hypothetical protein COA84_13705 [Robiginitomaculum sp.]
MESFIILVIWAAIIWLSVEMSKSRDREPVVWGILAALFGILAVIVLALIGTKRADRVAINNYNSAPVERDIKK